MSAKLISVRENIFGDEIAKVEFFDFSRGNLNEKNRITNITTVASICYQSPKSIGSESLFNRLAGESLGLPSSSFEFIPVLLEPEEVFSVCNNLGLDYFKDELLIQGSIPTTNINILKFGEWVTFNNVKYLLTNYRAIVYDYEESVKNNAITGKEILDLRKRYNSEYECDIIKQHYQVFRFKVDFPTRSQMVRHRVNLQELSRRYVSGKRVEFNHYISDKMKNIISTMTFDKIVGEVPCGLDEDLNGLAVTSMAYITEKTEISYSTQQVIDICMNHYYKALEDGVKPQEARRIIPQTGYTEFWMGFLPYQLANYFRLRDDEHAQWEVRQTAIAMKDIIGEQYGV